MRLLKLIAEIRYPSHTPYIFKYRDRIISKISPERITRQPISEGFQIFVKNKLMKVVVENVRLGIDIIFPHSIEDAQNTLNKIFKQTNTELNIDKIERIGIRTMWIYEVDTSFNDLVKVYKDKLFSTNKLIEDAFDVGLPLTLRVRDRRINFSSGPVEKSQLMQFINVSAKDYGEANIDSLPEKGVYIDNDYFLMKSSKYSDGFFEQFLKDGINDGIKRTKLLIGLLGFN